MRGVIVPDVIISRMICVCGLCTRLIMIHMCAWLCVAVIVSRICCTRTPAHIRGSSYYLCVCARTHTHATHTHVRVCGWFARLIRIHVYAWLCVVVCCSLMQLCVGVAECCSCVTVYSSHHDPHVCVAVCCSVLQLCVGVAGVCWCCRVLQLCVGVPASS